MSGDPPLSHEALLTLALKTEAAARDGDRERVETTVLRLLDALLHHVGAERPALLRLPAAEAQPLLWGQQRLIDILVDLAIAAQTPGACRCDAVAQQLLAHLSMQADNERRHLADTGPARWQSAMQVTEPLHYEHADLVTHLIEFDTIAAGLHSWPADTGLRLDAVVAFLRGVYPTAELAMDPPGATDTDTVRVDRVEILHRIDGLAELIDTVGVGPAAVAETERLRDQLCEISAILRRQFTTEEQVLFDLLEPHQNAAPQSMVATVAAPSPTPESGNAA